MMRRYVVNFILFFLLLWICPMSVEAKKLSFDYDDVIKLNKNYEGYMDTCDEEPIHKIKITKPGWYKVSVTFNEIIDENGNNVATEEDCLTYTVYNGSEEFDGEIYLGDTVSDTVGFEKGNAYIKINDFCMVSDYEISYTIKVVANNKKKVSFSKMSKLLKNNKKTYAKYKSSKSKAYLKINGVSDTDNHDEDGYALGFNAYPTILVTKQSKSSYMTFYLEGDFLCYSIPEMDDSDLTTLTIGNKKTKVTYDLDYSKEKNWFSYKDYFYKDECKWKCTVLNSYTATNSEVNKLIKIINGNGAYIRIKGDSGAYYKITLPSTTKKQWVSSLKIYKNMLKKYQ